MLRGSANSKVANYPPLKSISLPSLPPISNIFLPAPHNSGKPHICVLSLSERIQAEYFDGSINMSYKIEKSLRGFPLKIEAPSRGW